MASKKAKPLRQHNYITEARYDMSALQKNIFYLLLAEIQEDDNKENVHPFYPYYKINFHELERRMGTKVRMPELMEAVNGLVFRVYKIKEANGDELSSSLISSAENLPEENSIELGVSPMIKPYLLDLKKEYTEYELDTALNLKSKYSKRMYEILSQYKEEGKLSISVDELKYRFCIIDSETGEDIYSGWNMFEMHVLATPQKELKQHGDIEFNYDLIKTGKKYTDIVFHIKKKGSLPNTLNNESDKDKKKKSNEEDKKRIVNEGSALKDEIEIPKQEEFKKGIAKGQLSIIKNMLYKNHTITEVSSLTGLTIDEITRLLENIN
jgi:plasmid replication initiation protein